MHEFKIAHNSKAETTQPDQCEEAKNSPTPLMHDRAQPDRCKQVRSMPKIMGARYGTARNLCTITVLPVQLRSKQKDCLQETETYAVQHILRHMTLGVESLKMGIGLGHRWFLNTCQDEIGSKK